MTIKALFYLNAAIALLAASASGVSHASDQTDLTAKLAAAKKGSVVLLEPRKYEVGDLLLPAGVTLRGAGYNKTIIDAAAHKNGVVISGGLGAAVSDLSVRNARETGVLVSKATGARISRLKVVGNLTGLQLDGLTKSRIENLIVAKNRTGAGMLDNTDTSLANCSFVDNAAISLTVSGASNVAVFNNLFINSPTAVYLTRSNRQLALDYNFYIASFYGKMEGEVSRTSLPSWQRISAMDAHSVSMPLTFANSEGEDYRATSRLSWNPTLASTADWGASKVGTFAAPDTDIEGAKRTTTDLGAYEVTFPEPRKPDGYFNITTDDGVKSAALFNEANVSASVFFQNKPLHKGRHPFWLPARDARNLPLPAGSYQVRVVESQLSNQYIGLAGNSGASSRNVDNRSWAEEMFAFDAQDRVYIAQNAFENGMGVRAFDATYSTPRWMMPGGGGTVGVATDADFIYYLQRTAPGTYNLRKIALETGAMGQIAPGVGNRVFTDPFSGSVRGMAILDGKLYIADPEKGKIFQGSAADPKFTTSFDLPGATGVCVDAKTHLLWAIGEKGQLVALDPATGAVKATSTLIDGATDLAANNGHLAALSPKTGKIYLIDVADPANLKIARTIGTGDGPAGPQQADRFWFQTVPGRPNTMKRSIAVNSKGDMAVVDGIRVSFWGADGALKKQGLGFWGQHNYKARFAGDDDIRLWSMESDYSIKMDSKNKSWTPDTRWLLPRYTYSGRSSRAFFSSGGKNFGIYRIEIADPAKTADGKIQLRDFDKKMTIRAYLVVRLDTKDAVPVTLYFDNSVRKALSEVHDTNKDGIIDGEDAITDVVRKDGNKSFLPNDRYEGLPRENGDMIFSQALSADSTGVVIKMAGLDATGTYPVYKFDDPQVIPSLGDDKTAQFTSPYDFKTLERGNSSVQLADLSDGGYASSLYLRSSGGTGLANGAGTDIGGFGKDGRMRWLFKTNTVQGTEGVQSIPQYKMVLGMTSTQCDYMAMDEDGLGLGVLSMPKESNWQGMWSDHAQQQVAWVGNDGKPYYILGDYAVNGFHWFAITGTEKTKRQTVSVQISPLLAEALNKEPGLVQEKMPTPPTTKVTIARLKQPLTIDGDLKKWRDAGIAPAALVTPESGTADIVGPQDCSAVIRLAYEGSDLYVQTIVFDNVATFHQPLEKMYQEDGIEMGLNSFMQGFKYNVAITTDKGPTVHRNKFVVATADRVYSNEQVPRSIKVYDNTSEIEERKYIEAIYGVDLSKSKAIVTEFKLPLTAAVALDGDPAQIPVVASGKTFWIGFFLNDNDMPGGDIQKFLAWPATYGTFAVKEAGALATFE